MGHGRWDFSFKILVIGDSGVGKSSLLVSFISDANAQLSPTIGVDFKIKLLTIGGKRLKLTIWDTAGQERFRTLTSSYYRGAQGIILVYDVTRRETFTNLLDTWSKEVQIYSTSKDCIKMLVGNKVDKENERVVTREEGVSLAQKYGFLFLECSAKTRENVQQCFEDLILKILGVPSLLEEASTIARRNILRQKHEFAATKNVSYAYVPVAGRILLLSSNGWLRGIWGSNASIATSSYNFNTCANTLWGTEKREFFCFKTQKETISLALSTSGGSLADPWNLTLQEITQQLDAQKASSSSSSKCLPDSIDKCEI
ncbi:ras-related protein RABC2a [Cinnamomum micranthum f. kanehirae]|uniref:Ras-related protein RABC2a n=1 Tax=Cinnamomum micranthum f. kanehirae TaxID=337451 RepID=A0A443PMG8_9MAGN|nr:ras-related protein RABC2a [Cinnamomum micranthum f. kanehirae]